MEIGWYFKSLQKSNWIANVNWNLLVESIYPVIHPKIVNEYNGNLLVECKSNK